MMARHRVEMHAEAPPESIHMLGAEALAGPGVAFYVLRDGARPVGMGAIRMLGDGAGELKSMHVLAERRGQGLGRALLAALMAEARAMGLGRLLLETGSQPGFAAARALYASAGFRVRGPFAGYRDDPNSLYMGREL